MPFVTALAPVLLVDAGEPVRPVHLPLALGALLRLWRFHVARGFEGGWGRSPRRSGWGVTTFAEALGRGLGGRRDPAVDPCVIDRGICVPILARDEKISGDYEDVV